MINLFNKFQNLTPRPITTVVTITAINGDGTSNATTLGGVSVVIGGDTVPVNKKAYVRNGEIIRAAPSLAITEMSI